MGRLRLGYYCSNTLLGTKMINDRVEYLDLDPNLIF
jgi:hypothetical protein